MGVHRAGRRRRHAGRPDQGALHLAGPARLVRRATQPRPRNAIGRDARPGSAVGQPYLVNAGPSELLHDAVQRLPVRRRRHVHQRRRPGTPTASASAARNGDFNNFLQRHVHAQHASPTSTRPSVPTTGSGSGADGRSTGRPALDDKTSSSPARPAGTSSRSSPASSVEGRHCPSLPADYDLALYGDIGKAFDTARSTASDLTQLAAASAAGAPGSRDAGAGVPDQRHRHPDRRTTPPSATVRARGSTPRGSTRRGCTPRGSTRRGSTPRASTRPGCTHPTPTSPTSRPTRRSATRSRQRRTRRCSRCRPTPAPGRPRRRRRPPATPTGYFYVRVQGHDDAGFDAATPFHLGARGSSGIEDCVGLEHLRATAPSPGPDASDDEHGDRHRHPEDAGPRQRRRPTRGVPRLVGRAWPPASGRRRRRRQRISPRVAGAAGAGRRAHHDCPYADEPGGRARSRTSSDSYRARTPSRKYVVLAGGDEVDPVLPLPRHLRPRPGEPVLAAGARRHRRAAPASSNDQVLSQDAYGSDDRR